MSLQKNFGCTIAVLLVSTLALPVWAVYNQQGAVVVEDASAYEGMSLSFETSAGETVSVTIQEEDDDDNILFFIPFSGDRAESGVLTLHFANGRSQQFNVPAAGRGKALQVDLNRNRVALVDERDLIESATEYGSPLISEHRWNFTLGGGVGSMEVPEVASAIGSIVDGEETPLQYTDSDLDVDGYSLGLGYRFSNGYSLSASYFQASGDDSGLTEQLPNGTDFFIVNPDFDGSGSTGLFGGDIGGISEYDLDMDYSKVSLELFHPCNRIPGLASHIGVSYGQRDTKFAFSDSFVTFPDVYSQRDLEIEESLLKLRIGIDYGRPLGSVGSDGRGWYFQSRIGVAAQQLDADFTSTQLNSVFGTPEEISNDGSIDEWSYGVYGSVGLRWQLSPQVSLNPVLMFDSGLDAATAEYPISGDMVLDDQAVRIDVESTFNWGAGVVLVTSF